VNVDEITDATFEAEVLHAPVPVVVDFWAPWCGPCRAVAPIFEELAREHDGRVRFVRLNVDDNVGAASRYGVLSLPTAILFANGRAQEAVVGARRRPHYERAWDTWLSR
jgi:thioredoxin